MNALIVYHYIVFSAIKFQLFFFLENVQFSRQSNTLYYLLQGGYVFASVCLSVSRAT